MSLYKDFVKNYLKEADEQSKLQKVYDFILTGKTDVNIADILNQMSEEDIKKICNKNFKEEFLKNHTFDFKVVKDGKEVAKKYDFIEDSDNKVVQEFLKLFNSKNNNEGAKKFRAASGITTEQFADIIKKFTEKSRWSFQSAASEYEQLGRILTYRSIDVIYKLGDKEKIPLKDVQYALRNAFKTEKIDYLKRLEKIDTKMLIDAVAGVKESLSKRDESVNSKYVITLNEADASEIEHMDLKDFFNQVYSLENDDAIRAFLKPYINDHQEDVESNKKTLQARFEKGRKEIIEKEKSDKEQDFTDPVTGQVEKRVGRLGHFGPMTYIKNHEDLNKAIEAIDKQKWNIFNCAAKLLIKFFKVIEHGEKKWQEFLNDQRSAKKDIESDIDNKKQKDFNEDYKSIFNDSNRTKNEKYYDIIREYSMNVMKYENDFITPFNDLRKKPLVTNKDNKFYINQSTKDYINTVKHNLGNVLNGYNGAIEALKALDEQEAPQETASYKPVYNNPIIDEADEDKANTGTADAVRDAGEEAKKKEEPKKEEPKKEEKIDWRNTKFNFYFPESVQFGEMEKYYNDGAVKNYANVLQEMSKSIEDKNLKVVLEAFGKLALLFDGKSNNPRLLNNDEVITNTITAGELFEKSKALFDLIRQISDIPEFSDIEVGNIEHSIQKFTEQIKQVDNEVKFFNDTILLSIGQEKKEEPKDSSPEYKQELKNMLQITAGIAKDVEKTDKNTIKQAIEDIKNRKNEVLKKFNAFVENKTARMSAAMQAKKDGKIDTYFLGLIQGDKRPNEKTHVLPCIWTCISFLNRIDKLNSIYHMLENKLEDAKENAIKLINDCIPADINSEVYNKSSQQWYNDEYKQFTDAVGNMSKVVVNAKDKISEDQLKPLGINLEELINSLTNNETDPLLKLEYISGLIVEDEEKKEETNQEETQDKGTETNSGDTKAIGQDVSSKVPAKTEEKKAEESFSNELAEDLYKYLRG